MDSIWTLTPQQVRDAHEQLVADRVDELLGTEVDTPLYLDWVTLLKTAMVDAVDCRKITYWSRNADGQAIQLTGMLYLPRRLVPPPWPTQVSLIAYPHGTELLRDNVPSNNAGLEWVFGAAVALFAGYAVAMPDLPGMGGADPNAYHPYCHAPSLAYSVVDMIQAVRESFSTQLCGQYYWDGNLYILGYSEGGYAAMATVKELQLNADQYPGLRITGSACMAGPFDLTGAMRDLMIHSTEQYGSPFFLPYMIRGYYAVYGAQFDPNQALNTVLLPDILSWTDGFSLPSATVNTLIAGRFGLPDGQFPAPRDMLNPTWVNQQLADNVYETSPVGRILTDNNLWSGWVPERPMLIRHSPDDDRVPYANSERTVQVFSDAGAPLTFIPIGNAGDGITHVTGAIIGIPTAIIWFRDVCPKY
jgi:pimeloyl-ACP methyl ester carboxylesterase